MKEILIWADSPTVSTGFGTVSRNLLTQLNKLGKYRFTVLGISHLGLPFDVEQYPYLKFPQHGGLYPAAEGNDVYGFQKALRMMAAGQYDIVFILQDPFVLQHTMPQIIALRNQLKRKFSIVYYFPLDMPAKTDWINTAISNADFPVTYTEYAKGEIARLNSIVAEKTAVIPHGTDTSLFRPIRGDARQAIRKTVLGELSNRYFILNVNRNQPRKNLNQTFEVFARVHKKFPETYLYILAALNDVGGNLNEIAERHGLVYGRDWNCPPPQFYNPNQGLSIDMVRNLYCSADLVMTTTLGEGWGLSMTEAMACETPVIAPRNTSLPEIIGENEERGWLAKSGGTGRTFVMGTMDNSYARPLVDVEDMADKIIKIIRYPGSAKKKAEKALAWVQDWEALAPMWEVIFDQAAQLSEELSKPAPVQPAEAAKPE